MPIGDDWKRRARIRSATASGCWTTSRPTTARLASVPGSHATGKVPSDEMADPTRTHPNEMTCSGQSRRCRDFQLRIPGTAARSTAPTSPAAPCTATSAAATIRRNWTSKNICVPKPPRSSARRAGRIGSRRRGLNTGNTGNTGSRGGDKETYLPQDGTNETD